LVRDSDELYDVCFSFAGEDRGYVRQVAAALTDAGVRVFFDEYEVVDLWGRDLYQHLSEVYRRNATFCVIFISNHYAAKVWPRHELQSAQARAFGENREYILPARFDDTELPGLLPTTGYVDLRVVSPKDLADLITRKLRRTGSKPEQPSPQSPSFVPEVSGPPILTDQPQLRALRRRLSEPLEEVERYHRTVQELTKLGRWGFNIAFPYPDRLVDADDRLRDRVSDFGRELRNIATTLNEQFEASRPRTGTIFDAYAKNYFGNVANALRTAAGALDAVDGLRDVAKRGATLDVLRATESYQGAATALNEIADAIDAAQRERQTDDNMVKWFRTIGKNQPK
jgi:hypothetical protein